MRTFLTIFFFQTVGPTFAESGSTIIAMPTLIAIVVSCIVFALFIGLLLMFCRCKRRQTKKSVQAKDYEMDSVRPSIVAQQNQAPPPYYPASGLENKALEHSMDLALAMEDQKSAIYASQNGYGYQINSGMQVPPHAMGGNECKYIINFPFLTFLFVVSFFLLFSVASFIYLNVC